MRRGPARQFDPDQALHEAMKVFWAKGYAAAGLSELLGAMGISRQSLYDTYGSKRELFLLALERYAETFIGGIIRTLDGQGSPLNNVRRALQHFEPAAGTAVNNGCFVGVGMGQFRRDDPAMAAALQKHLVALEDAFYRALKRAVKEGELSAQVRPRDIARMLTATAQGLALRQRVEQSPAAARSTIRAMVATLDALRA